MAKIDDMVNRFMRRWFHFRYGHPPEWHRLKTEAELETEMRADPEAIIEEVKKGDEK